MAGWPASEVLVDDGGSSSGTASLMAFSHEPHKALIRDFLDAMEQDRDPAITGEVMRWRHSA